MADTKHDSDILDWDDLDEGKKMKIAVASDHAGFTYKEIIKTTLMEHGHEVTDFGTRSTQAVDYPDYIRPAAQAVASGKCEYGIVFGGSGNGEAIVANKVKGIRCAIAWDLRSAKLSRQHNDANMLSIGERMMSIHEAIEIVELWLETPFQGGRHLSRIRKIESP